MLSNHAKWIAECADRCVAAVRESGRATPYTVFANVAHQIAQARPAELREFVESYPPAKSLEIAPLMVLAWRIVGNEYRTIMASIASDAISSLCDIDEWANAVSAFSDDHLDDERG